MAIHDETNPVSNSSTQTHTDARQTAYVAFLHRVPFALDALTLGFLPGFREDCTYQQSQFETLKCPVGMLDNDFRNPDLERYVDRTLEYEPDVGIIGDAYDVAEAQSYVETIRELHGSLPETEFIIVPKCRAAIEAVPDDIVLGYSRGYAETLAHEFSDPVDWRGRRVHILGGSPPNQLEVVEQLTQPTLTGNPPADIVGLDWNGLHRGAQFGEFWTADGWDDSGRDADHVTVRKTVRHSLSRLKEFWQAHGVWPDSTPQTDESELSYSGPTPSDIESAACTECNANVWTTEHGPYVAEYDTGDIYGYCSYDCYFSHRHRNNLEEVVGDQSVYVPPAQRQFCFSCPEGRGLKQKLSKQVISMSQQQSPNDVSIDAIPVDIANTQSGEVESADVPEEIRSITRGLASEQPPTNPLVVLKAARWWYIHGKGGTDPAFQWAIEWVRHLAADTPTDGEQFDEYLDYLVTVGLADEPGELR